MIIYRHYNINRIQESLDQLNEEYYVSDIEFNTDSGLFRVVALVEPRWKGLIYKFNSAFRLLLPSILTLGAAGIVGYLLC
jgi:hypothetical protein